MKARSIKILGGILALALIIYSCTKEEQQLLTKQATDNQEEARVITYNNGKVIPGQYIVVYKKEATPVSDRSVTAENYLAQKETVKEFTVELLKKYKVEKQQPLQTYAKTIQGFAVQLSDDEVERLRKDASIDYIEQDQTVQVTMGGPPGGGGGSDPTGQDTPWGITRVGGAVGGASGTAWVIDSGIDMDHEDLNVDVARSMSFLTGGGPSNQEPEDGNGHGTHVAGTIAAIDNDIGVVGVAAGATVVAVRVLDKRGSGSYSGVIAGVDHVGANASNGDVANMSLGGGTSDAVDAAVVAASANCKFAIAAGNSSADANNYSPARVNGSNIYTVSSMAEGDNWSYFSNYGNPPVDFCAPGSSVLSTYKDGGYATLSGTSMAAPHVAGILLLGNVGSDGNVSGDPDGDADPIAHH